MTLNGLSCPYQFAYKKHHSTETILVKVTNDILMASDSQTATVLMLLDLSAAFDTVDHGLLLKILNYEIGIRGTALAWFSSFLKGRAQRVRLGNITSETVTILFGVPQGSVLGPVLFNIYIRSIYKCVQKLGFKIFGYADDHQVLKSFVPSEQLKVLSIQLVDCFDAIQKWMMQYFLQLNGPKTQLIIFGSSRIFERIVISGAHLNLKTTVRFVSVVKNLGFTMDNKLNFQNQIIMLKKKCFCTIRNIFKIRYLLSADDIKIVVNSMIMSCLDYCNCLYFGIGEKLLNQLQIIQNSAAKVITGKKKHDHVGSDLTMLHWLDIKKRIIFKIALLAYKAINGLAPAPIQDMFQYAHYGHALKLVTPYVRSKYGQRSFSFVATKLYNNLPSYITCADNTTSFKKLLKTFLFKLPISDIKKLTN